MPSIILQKRKRKKQSDEGRDLSFHDDEVRKKLHT
jgi:hypothetical protein